MDGLDLLGAVSTGLSKQFITLQIKSIDTETLKNKLGGNTGAIASSAMPLVDTAPKAALDMAMPFIVKTAKGYGIDLGTTVTNTAPSKGRSYSEFFPGLAFGVVIGAASFGILKMVSSLFRRDY